MKQTLTSQTWCNTLPDSNIYMQYSRKCENCSCRYKDSSPARGLYTDLCMWLLTSPTTCTRNLKIK